MFWLEPTTQTSPVLGAVRVSEPLIAKAALESSVTVASAFRVIRTFTVVEIASGTVHGKLQPAAGVEAEMKTASPKVSVADSSFSTAPSLPAVDQVMGWVPPTHHAPPP